MNKLESKNKVVVKGKVFGGDRVLSCIPMVPETLEQLITDTQALTALNPDLIEWRVDSFRDAADPDKAVEALEAVNKIVGDIPIIFTLRATEEGGAQKLTESQRLETITACLKTGKVDIVDVEARCNTKDFIKAVRHMCTEYNTALVLSTHFFKMTPTTEEMKQMLIDAQELGADIPKLAVMPQDFQDVLNLMSATYQVRANGQVTQPMVTMSMSETGKITRVIGNCYGSDMSFVLGKDASAPGQIPVSVINQLWDLLN